MKLPSQIITAFLQAEGIGTIGTDLFVNQIPGSSKVSMLCIYDTGGGGAETSHDCNQSDPTVQILAIGSPGDAGTNEAIALAQAAESALVNDFGHVADGDVTYLSAQQRTGLMSLGNDGLNRARLSQNFVLYRSEQK